MCRNPCRKPNQVRHENGCLSKMALTNTGTTTVNYLRNILTKFPKECNYCFAYGSGVFLQKNQKPGKMIDLIFVVNDPVKWHEENLRMNYSHYSGLRRLGPKWIAQIQEKMACGVYYNPFVKVDSSVIKYGVISTAALEDDLSHWSHLYVAGRLHKPVLDVIPPQSEKLVSLIEKNRESALRAALLLNSRSLRKTDLYYTITELSYIGDFRMAIGEHPDKVKNIVTPLIPYFDHIYYPLLVKLKPMVNMDKHGIITQEIDSNGRLHHLMVLPHPLQRSLARRIRHDPRVSDVEDAMVELSHYPNVSPYVRKSIAEVVRGSSILQTAQGVLSAGVIRSIKYGFEKIMKKVTAKRAVDEKPLEATDQQLLPPPGDTANPVVEYKELPKLKPKENTEHESCKELVPISNTSPKLGRRPRRVNKEDNMNQLKHNKKLKSFHRQTILKQADLKEA